MTDEFKKNQAVKEAQEAPVAAKPVTDDLLENVTGGTGRYRYIKGRWVWFPQG
jgi:hypothetical protein